MQLQAQCKMSRDILASLNRSIAGAIGDADGVVSALGYSGFNLGALL